MNPLAIDAQRLQRQIDELAAISEAPPPVVTRVLFSEADLRGCAFVKNLCREIGLELREDAVGNLFARWPGMDASLAPVATGSHIDAIPNAGRYDGVVGVLGALEAMGAVNSVPFHAYLEIDLRDTQLATRDAALAQVEAAANEICKRRGIDLKFERLNADAPATCDARLVETVAGVCKELNLRVKKMISRAYHDTPFMAQVCTTTMIFIPCRGGVSHRTDEYSSPEQIKNGVIVLAHTLAKLAA